MKKNLATATLAAIIFMCAYGHAMAAEYKVTWKNNLPIPTGLLNCSRTISGISTNGVDTQVKNRSALNFGVGKTTPMIETFSYAPPLGCGKIKLRISCAYKADGDITEFMTEKDVVPCHTNITATINLYTLSVD